MKHATALLVLLAATGRGSADDDPLPDGALARLGSARFRHGEPILNSALSADGRWLATASHTIVGVREADTGRLVRRFRFDPGETLLRPGLAISPDRHWLGYVRSGQFACVWDLRTGMEARRVVNPDRPFTGCQFSASSREFAVLGQGGVRFYNVADWGLTRTLSKPATFLSADGKRFVRVEIDKAVVLGDAATGEEQVRIEASAADDGVNAGVALSPDGRLIALVHADREVQVRDADTGKVRLTFPAPAIFREVSRSCRRMAFTDDNAELLLGTHGGVVHRWDLTAKRPLPPLKWLTGMTSGIHPLPDGKTILTTADDGLIRRWDRTTGDEVPPPDGYTGAAILSVSADGRVAAVGDALGRLDVWDLPKRRRLRTLSADGPAILNVAVSPDGSAIAAGNRHGTIRVWGIETGREGGSIWRLARAGGGIRTLQFSPDGRSLLASERSFGNLQLWDLTTGERRWSASRECAAAFAPDGKTIVMSPGGSQIAFIDVATGRQSPVRINTVAYDNVSHSMPAMAYSPDGRLLAVSVYNGEVLLLDAGDASEVRRFSAADPFRGSLPDSHAAHLHHVAFLTFSPDGGWLLTAGTDRSVRLWEVVSGKQLLRRDGHEGAVHRVGFTAGARQAVSSGNDGQVLVWDLRPGGSMPAPETCWADLASQDGEKAYRALWGLAEGRAGVTELRKALPAAKPLDPDWLKERIVALDSDSFRRRQSATRELAEVLDQAAPALREAVKRAPSAESRERLERLLERVGKEAPLEEVRRARAVRAMELSELPESRELLRSWAGGDPTAGLTRRARDALQRVGRSAATPAAR